jgi:diguanylate cyclase (GGDEF)-like protein/PAS domain S-box-containing protein
MSASAGWAHVDPAALSRFFDMSLDLLALADAGGRLTRVSRSWEATLGWTTEEMTSGPFIDFLHPGDRVAATEAFTEIFSGMPAVSFHTRCRHRNGAYREIEWNAYREQGDAYVYAVARDVTDARRSERRHRALNEAWLAVASEQSVEEVLSVVNEQARVLIGARQAVTSITVGGQWAQAVTAVSFDDTNAQWRSYDAKPDGSGIYAEVLRTNAPMRLTQAELEAHPLWRGFGVDAAQHPPMRGWLAVPMTGRSEGSLGLIQLSDKVDGSDFDETDERSLMEFARVAALTIERARAEATATEAREQLEGMLDSISDAFVAFDSNWRITYVNPAARTLVQGDADAMGALVWDVFPDTTEGHFERQYLRAVEQHEQITFRAFHEKLQAWFDVRVFPFRSGLAVYFVDVTEREAATDDLERRVAMQAVVAELGQAALTGLDAQTLIDQTVMRVAEVLRVTNVGVLQLVYPSGGLALRSGVTRASADDPFVHNGAGEEFTIASLGNTAISRCLDTFDWAVMDEYASSPAIVAKYDVASSIAVPIGRRGNAWGVLCAGDEHTSRFAVREGVFLAQVAHILSSAIDRHESETVVRHQATHDALTGLPNRQLLRDRMDAALGRLTIGAPGATLLLLDLDGFKDVNDSLGHATGDIVLQQVADRLSALVSAGNIVARLGGDEFAVLVESIESDEDAMTFAQQIVAAIAVPFSLPELDVPLSTSVGVVRAPTHGTDASTLMRRADVAMYRAKAQSLGWAMYDDDLDAARADRLNTIAELRRGIHENELVLHYQPIVDLESGAVCSLEALVRWQHPVHGLTPPLSFIPLAEQTGLIVPLTAWVVDEALRQSAIWHRVGFTPRIAVNLSVDVLTREMATDPLFARLVSAPDRITAEITESSLVDERARHAVIRLAAAGVACAVDDFGTGYSSLAYLKDLPIAQLKIDRAFVADVARTDRDMAIVRSVAELGHALDMAVVAEGVEHAESANALRKCGVRLAQGYFFARPMRADALEQWLADR